MADVVTKSGGNYDIVIDNGGHWGAQICSSFEVLWPALVDGGLYIVEDLSMLPSNDSFVRDILGWQDQLLGVNFEFPYKTDVGWTKFPFFLGT
jgi:hypothetical protein